MSQALMNFWGDTGFANVQGGQVVMILVSFVLLFLAIKKGFEPLLLVPIAFGMLLANLPVAGVMAKPIMQLIPEGFAHASGAEGNLLQIVGEDGSVVGTGVMHLKSIGGLLYYLFQGDHLGIFPPLIFLGVGAMTDFGPLIANPKSLLLGAAAQFGIYVTFAGAIALGFTAQEASAIGIIGGADGPTAIFLASQLAPQKLGAIAVAAYSYMALVPVIQPPIMRALTTKQERSIKMSQLRNVSKVEKIIFPIVVTILVSLIVPPATALVGMLMLGNLFKESGVVGRLTDTAQNALMNIVTIFLGVTVGATASAEYFLQIETLKIIALGIVAFGFGTATGVLLAKLMNKLWGGTINPLIGSAGVSAVPMAARVSQVEGQKADPSNFLLMHAMGPNVAGVIGSAVSAGVLLSLFG
ncbi:sodium ion-translocating decarboxylase subunit beta [Acidaminobacter sp. JC074]|uniref:sodium ion-translocating decarboxylase subunit beta n=1 Tax=Acidaminobacter sp. JC074 TaxID=2530199 RepID=UPI001F114CAF|nr:sodium ion-translocating decarboxylase subunit beta [Acidaminobacter sp. JC074]MCH4890722.1 sodium ion-translocating decarboxylase subunit beta [Acidaminobacter sp. JC074]